MVSYSHLMPVYSDTTQLNSTSSWVQLSCVAINGPLVKPPPQKWRLYATAMSICLSVRLFVCLSVPETLHPRSYSCHRCLICFLPVKNFPVKSMLATGAYSWHPLRCHICLYFKYTTCSHTIRLFCAKLSKAEHGKLSVCWTAATLLRVM